MPAQRRQHGVALGGAHLQHRTQLFRKQSGQHALVAAPLQNSRRALAAIDIEGLRIVGQQIQIEGHAAMAGEGHLTHRGVKAAIGTIVIGEQFPIGIEPLNCGEKALQRRGLIDVGRGVAHLPENLREY